MANQTLSNLAVDAPELVDLKENHPQLRIWTPSSDDFKKLSSLYIKGSSVPRAIVRPQSEDEVSAAVAYAAEKSIPVAIRAGGHDYLARSGPNGALVLDLRDLKGVDIVDDGKAAIIGGGIIAMDLANALGKTGHTTTYGASNTVGHVGWATHGGYGPFAGLFGLGVDQILGARVVDYQGRIFDADDELLYGIRGAGSAFGVIVSLKIKIHKLETVCRRSLPWWILLFDLPNMLFYDKVYGGNVIFAMGPVEHQLDKFLENYQDMFNKGCMPKELGLSIGVCNVPHAGKAIFCSFLWASTDTQAGKAALAKVQEQMGLPILMSMVAEMTPAAWVESRSKTMPPYGVYAAGGPASASVPALEEDVRSTLVQYTASMPANPATLWVENHLHGAALESTVESCFAYRRPHFLVEMIGTSVQEELAQEAGEWAVAFHETARGLKNTLEGGYVVFVPPQIPARLCFPGGHWERLQELKAKWDPNNVFAFSAAGLDGKS